MRRLTCPYRHEVIVAFASLVFASVSLLLSAFDTPGPRDIPVAAGRTQCGRSARRAVVGEPSRVRLPPPGGSTGSLHARAD